MIKRSLRRKIRTTWLSRDPPHPEDSVVFVHSSGSLDPIAMASNPVVPWRTIYSKRTIACGFVWKMIGVEIHEGAAILHPRSNKIKARSPSHRAIVMQQRMTSYPLVALCFMICHPQRTTWRLNQERGPCVVPAVPSVACIAEYEEKSVESETVGAGPRKCAHVA